MDHIARPSRPENDPIQVPCLGTEEYDGRPFLTYPERRGISSSDLLMCDISVRSPQMVGFVQTWLFFGLLSAVLERTVTIAEYTRTDSSGNLLINTTGLADDLGTWVDLLKSRPQQSLLDIERRISEYFYMAFRVLAALERMTEVEPSPGSYHLKEEKDRAEDFHGILPPTVDLSIRLLIDTISSAPRLPGRILLDLPFQWNSNGLLRNNLRDAGYCPHMIAQLRLPLLCYASLTKAKGRSVDHKRFCTVRECVANNVGSFRLPEHVERACNCAMVSADMSEVLRIVQKGGTPLIGHSLDRNGRLRVIEGTASRPYTAISHVFADGLGNTEANALPLCQVEKIRKTVQTLPKHTVLEDTFGRGLSALIGQIIPGSVDPQPFWIDTLCVPVESVSKTARRMAISGMQKVYQDAANVLVLDRGLQQTDGEASATELLFRIISSAWCSRLWTLQEANLAYQMHFVLRGRIRDGFSLIREHLQETDFGEHKCLAMLDMIQWMPHFERSSDAKRMKVLFTALQYRVTSWKGDEAICTAVLIGQDPSPLLDPAVAPEDRFELLVSQLQEVPADIIFLKGPKLTTPGLRWSPSSLMVPDSDRFVPLSGDKVGIPCAQGLQVTFPGILIDPLADAIPAAADQLYVMNAAHTVSYTISFTRATAATTSSSRSRT